MLFDSTYVSLLSERYKSQIVKAVQIYNVTFTEVSIPICMQLFTLEIIQV